MTYEELAKAILDLPEGQRKRKAVISNCYGPSEIRMEIDRFAEVIPDESDPDDFIYLETKKGYWR